MSHHLTTQRKGGCCTVEDTQVGGHSVGALGASLC